MGRSKWRRVALAAILASAPIAVASAWTPAQAASGFVMSLTASPKPALSDSDDVYLNGSGTHDSSCARQNKHYIYKFNFGDGSPITTTTYAFAYHYFHVPAGPASEPFKVTLTVTDSCSNSGTTSLIERVDRDTPPSAHLKLAPSSSTDCGSSGFEIYADASGTTDNGLSSPDEFDFFWGDGKETTTYAPTEFACHRYRSASSPEDYPVTVDVFDFAGLEDTTTGTIGVPTSSSPRAPTDVQAVAGSDQATVSWSAPASGGTPSSYTVTATPGGDTATVNGSLLHTQVDGLTNGQTYTLTVTATRGGRSFASQPSNPVIPLGQPGAPTQITATETNGAAVVAWTPPRDDGSSKPLSYHQGQLGYRVTVTTPQGTLPTVTVSGNPAPTNVTIPGLTNGVPYTFTVSASNSVATSVSAPPTSATPEAIGPTITKGPAFKLVQPSTVGSSATNLSLSMNVIWIGKRGAAPICSYALEQSIDAGSWTPVPLTSPMATSATATIPKSLDRVRFQVEATDCSGAVSGWVQSPEFGYQFYEESDAKFTYSSGWSSTRCPDCAKHRVETTTTPNAVATLTLNAAYNVGLIFEVGPNVGRAEILQTGKRPTYVDTYSPTPGFRMLLFKTGWSPFRYAVIQVVNVGAGIDLDGAVVLYAPLARLGT